MSIIAHVGIDAHGETLSICVLPLTGSDEPIRTKIANRPEVIRGMFCKLSGQYDLECCYEASSGGYVLQRQLVGMGIKCDVIAPSLIPKRPGDKIKTDKRDAYNLARLYRAGELTIVHPPTAEEESVRRVTRLREQFVRDVVESKNQLNLFLGGIGRRYPEKSRWTQKHWKWLTEQTFESHDQLVFDELLAMLMYKLARLSEVNSKVSEIAASGKYKEAVGKLCCLRGVGEVTAMTLISEIIDFSRFPSATSLMKYLGLVPSERSSGGSRNQGSITKAGNAHCRRVLVEAGWKAAHKPVVGAALKARQAGQPASVVAHAWKAQVRLNKKFKLVSSRRPRQVAAVAVARELVGFVWSIMTNSVVAG